MTFFFNTYYQQLFILINFTNFPQYLISLFLEKKNKKIKKKKTN
jgi:hypothetical protein